VTGAPPARRYGPFTLLQWLATAAALAVVLLGAGYAYHRGQVAAGLDLTQVALERRELEGKAERLESDNARLNARIAELEMARRLDRDAYGQVEQTIGDLQSQLSRQGDDLAFYRSIVSPADGIQGVRIHRFEVAPGDEPREFLLKLTLIQAMRHESVASGLTQVVVHGVQGDTPARYSVGELLGRPRAQLPFSFRYFQAIEQAVTLPEGFEAFEAEVEVRSSKLRFPIRQTFPWKIGPQSAL